MKKLRFFLVSFAAFALTFTGCKDTKEPVPGDTTGTKVTLAEIVDAASSTYKSWEEGEGLTDSFKVGSKDFNAPEYQFAICQALVNISKGEKGDITVPSYKPAAHPERDSYDKETIAVTNGPKNGEETEDLVNVASRMLARMVADLQVPNQTNFTRNGSAIAFSTDRATIVISRALAGYKADGKLAESVSADYKGAAATLKAFATELVKYLDVWEKTVGTVDADGSHCTSNKTAWQNVHFIPIEYSGGYKDGEMYDEGKFPIWHPVVDGREYTAAECWSVAAQGILDLVTVEGSSLMQPSRNPFVHTMGNGKSLSEPIPTPAEYATVTGFNAYPWYENTNDGAIINFSDKNPCTVEFLCHELGWYLTRCTQFDTPAIGNFQQFGKGESVINYGEYEGIISAMRTFLIMIRFYDYLLKNNITENVWDAVKDVHLDYDLYGVDMPDIELKTMKLNYDWKESTKEANFTAKEAWTATPTVDWITVDPASGEKKALFNWSNLGLASGDAHVCPLPDGKFAVIAGTFSQTQQLRYEFCIVEPGIDDRTVLTMFSLQPENSVLEAVALFNKSNDAYRIELNSAFSMSQDVTAEEWNNAIQKFSVELIAGEIPDILDLNNLPVEALSAAGYLVDLYPYLYNDPSIRMEDYYENVFTAMSIHGKLPFLTSSVQILTMFADENAVGTKRGWTVEEYAALRDSGEIIVSGLDPTQFLELLLAADSQFVNWETGKCSFDSEAFVQLLELCKSMVESEASTQIVSPDSQANCRYAPLTSVIFVAEYNVMFGRNANPIGFPNASGDVMHILIPANKIGFTTACEHPDGAWAFARSFLEPTLQESGWFFPYRKSSFEKIAAAAIKGNTIWTGGMYDGDITEQDLALARELLGSALYCRNGDDGLTEIILDCAQEYFFGELSAREAADLAQRRATLYIGERR